MRGVLCLIASLCGLDARALDPSFATTQYAQHVWRAPETLPHDDVTAIAEDHDGYLWVGTVDGLARFDGVRSVIFQKSNTPAFTNNWVKALLEDRRGRLWIATYGGGVLCRENGRFVRYGAAQGLPTDLALSLLEDREGHILVGTTAGVVRFEDGRFIREPGTESTASSNVTALLQDRHGVVWIGANDGLYRDENHKLTQLTMRDGLSDYRMMALAEDREGLWVGTERGGVDHIVGGTITAITTRNGLSHDRIWSLAVDRDDNVWIGTDGGGLDRITAGHLSSFSTHNGLTNDFVWAIHEDRAGDLWVGTNGGGLNRLKAGRVVPLTTREGLPSNFAWAIQKTADGSLWIGTEDAGLVRIHDGTIATYTTHDGLTSNQVKSLYASPDGSLWIGGGAGLDVWRNGRILSHPVAGVPVERVNALAGDAAGRLWIATDRHGLWAVEHDRILPLPDIGDLASQSVNGVVAAADGSIWFGTVLGLGHLTLASGAKPGSMTAYTMRDGLPSNRVSSVFEAPAGVMWVATQNGLARIEKGRIESVTSRNGLPEDSIATALTDGGDGIWYGTNRGLFRVSRREIEDVLEGRRSTIHSITIGLDDGLPSVEINGGGSSSFRDREGKLWFATRGGVVSLDPAKKEPGVRVPRAIIEEVRADDRLLPGGGGWRLAPETRRIAFVFTAPELAAPGRIRFARKLEGFDANWVEAGAVRSAEYTNLPHGHYRFRVTTMNEEGAPAEPETAVEFDIAPRFYETLWFRSLAILLFAVAGPLFYAIRVRRLRHQKEVLERLVAARTAEVEAANVRLEQLSREDSLTGVANRRRLDEVLDEEWRRAERAKDSLGLLLLDIDFFKAYNDALGHPAGDACIKDVAGAVSDAHRRAGELVARYGGEEFAVVMPGISREELSSGAEAMRRQIENRGWPHPSSSVSDVLTVSIGVAWATPAAGGSPAELVAAADRALYAAKRDGRNCVRAAFGPEP